MSDEYEYLVIPYLRLWALFCIIALSGVSHAQDGGGLGGPGAVELQSALETLLVDEVVILPQGSSGDASLDTAIIELARTRIGLHTGDRLSSTSLEIIRLRIGQLDGVSRVRARLAPSGADAMRTRIIVEVSLAPEAEDSPATTELPFLWRSEHGGLRVILNGGHGVFSDGNPWFGNAPAFTTNNPLVQNPAIGANTGSRATWVESWVEFGLGGVTQIVNSNTALYGAATGIAPIVRGQDIFRDDPRESLDVEKAYIGLLWGSDNRAQSANLSIGRQNFTLNDGFLISQFGSQWNAGPRPGIYLAPRTAQDFAAIGTFKLEQWTATGFYLNPNEYEPLESNTRVAGLNLRYNFSDQFYADGTVIQVPESDTRYATPSGYLGTREGLQTYAAHIRWADRTLAPGLWTEWEAAYQRHADFPMSAWAGYGTLGYFARDTTWTPSLSYRFSAFSGDDPATERYERFDALYSGGLSEWLQGISLGKVLRPENRFSHRVRFNLTPTERLNLTLDWFLHRADELNNIGANPAIAQLSSPDLGQEISFTGRWAISDRLYFLGLIGVAIPGEAIKSAANGNASPWTTLQAQLFWTF